MLLLRETQYGVMSACGWLGFQLSVPNSLLFPMDLTLTNFTGKICGGWPSDQTSRQLLPSPGCPSLAGIRISPH